MPMFPHRVSSMCSPAIVFMHRPDDRPDVATHCAHRRVDSANAASNPLRAAWAAMVMLCAGLATASPAHALQRLWPAPAPLVRMQVLERDNGRVLPVFPHRGDQWIEGTPGHGYAVRLTNLADVRVLVVLSVDGINAVSGETAAADQAGYVLAPGQNTEITGWRKSLDDVARFVFTDLGDSYAARTGRPRNVGVIGIAVFREATPLPLPAPPIAYGAEPADGVAREAAADAARASAPATAAAAASRMRTPGANAAKQSLGTGHGQREWSPVARTRFERAGSAPEQLTTLRYDNHTRLLALGVLPRRPPQQAPRPQAFPGGFVADPDGR